MLHTLARARYFGVLQLVASACLEHMTSLGTIADIELGAIGHRVSQDSQVDDLNSPRSSAEDIYCTDGPFRLEVYDELEDDAGLVVTSRRDGDSHLPIVIRLQSADDASATTQAREALYVSVVFGHSRRHHTDSSSPSEQIVAAGCMHGTTQD